MNKKTFMIQAILAACCIITSCSSDTVDGNKEYFTHGQIAYTLEDESKIFFFDNEDGTTKVTYDHKYPIQLNANNQAKLTTYVGTVTIPKTFVVEGKTYRVTSVDEMAFANCAKAKKIELNEGITSIGNRAFLGCTSVTEMTLPSTVNQIGENAFLRASKLTKIHVKATTPPVLIDSLGDYISKATLFVPTGSKSAYEADKLWSKFKTIEEE